VTTSLIFSFETGLVPENCFFNLFATESIWLGNLAILDLPSADFIGDPADSHFHFVRLPEMFLHSGHQLRLCTGEGKNFVDENNGARVTTVYLGLMDYHFNVASQFRARLIQFEPLSELTTTVQRINPEDDLPF
jgi:hypothetical protein